MALYRYVKAPIAPPPVPVKSSKSKLSRLLPPVFITLGSILIANVAWPIISYQFFTAPSLRRTEFVSPVAKDQLGSQPPTLPGNTPADNQTPQVLGAQLDYTDPQNWFPLATYKATKDRVRTYTIDIPNLNIENARVSIGGENLDDSLIHFPETALPGQSGSTVIFGHSVLRQFYNPKEENKDRYVSIFSKIMTLKSGDRIYADFDGIRYTYEVKDIVEVEPEDVFILEQRYNTREMKLITCVPEGTYLHRGVVIAQLIDFD